MDANAEGGSRALDLSRQAVELALLGRDRRFDAGAQLVPYLSETQVAERTLAMQSAGGGIAKSFLDLPPLPNPYHGPFDDTPMPGVSTNPALQQISPSDVDPGVIVRAPDPYIEPRMLELTYAPGDPIAAGSWSSIGAAATSCNGLGCAVKSSSCSILVSFGI